MPDIAIIEKGGVVMMLLIMMSIYAFAVIFYKIFQFIQSGVFGTEFINPVMNEVKKGELTAAEHKLQRTYGPIATVMKVAIVCVTNRLMSNRSREAEISRVGSSEIRRLEGHMRGLEVVAMTAPLLGLLGTVMGMVTAFAKLGEAGSRVDPSMLAGGIWEALLTTVGGLVVAIPAVIAYYALDGVIERVRATMRDVTVQIMSLEDEFMRNEEEQVRREQNLQVEEREAAREKREAKNQEKFLQGLQAAQESKAKDTGKKQDEAVEQAVEKALEDARTMPQNSSTLRLLSPSYNRY